MEGGQGYTVAITREAENYYRDVLEYFYKHHSEASADRKSTELLEKAIALENNPGIGRIEENLRPLGRMHRLYFVLLHSTKSHQNYLFYQ